MSNTTKTKGADIMNVKEATKLVCEAIDKEVTNNRWRKPRHLELDSTLVELDDMDDDSALDSMTDQSKSVIESLS